jgi:hypothetical protein
MKGIRRALRQWTTIVAAGAAISVRATEAHAAGPPNEGPTEIVAKERPTTRYFYGWQILATGEAGGVVAAAATVLADSPLKTLPSTLGFLVGMPFYVLGGPATHWTHGDFDKGLISLGGNFTLPVIGGFIGQAVSCSARGAPDDCGATGFFAGFAVALVTAPVVDALVLGWEDIPDDAPAPVPVAPSASAARTAPRLSSKRAARFSMTPTWNVGPKRELLFGVAGRF